MPKVIAALGRLEARQRRADGVPKHIARATARFPEDRFQFPKCVFDRIQIGTVFRQKPEARPDVFNRTAHRRALVTRQVVQDDDVPGGQRRDEDLLDVGEEARAINRAIKHGRRGEARHAKRSEKRRRMPAPVGRMIGYPGAVETTPIPPHQVGPHATFIEKHQPRGIEAGRRGVPGESRERDVSAIVFGRAYRFF